MRETVCKNRIQKACGHYLGPSAHNSIKPKYHLPHYFTFCKGQHSYPASNFYFRVFEI